MDRRYKLFAEAGARNIDGYNEMSGFQALPYIVLFIDELADIMLFSPVEVEDAITRIAQMSRATGIHMVLATQRPSVDVITGLIKANIPSRIAFAVASQVDSRVILDTQGAEKLLGKGDMLYLPPEQAKPMRIQGAFVNDKEINAWSHFSKIRELRLNIRKKLRPWLRPDRLLLAELREILMIFLKRLSKLFASMIKLRHHFFREDFRSVMPEPPESWINLKPRESLPRAMGPVNLVKFWYKMQMNFLPHSDNLLPVIINTRERQVQDDL